MAINGTLALTQRLYNYNVCAHNSLPTSAILVLRLLKKIEEEERKKMMNNLCGHLKSFFRYLALCKHILAVLKVATNTDTTLENAYMVNQPESTRQRRKTDVFVKTASETPYYTIMHVFSRFWHCCRLLCKRSSSIHNYSY